jgi:hypothetical protein
MSNTLIPCSIIAKEALAVLENMLSFSKGVNRNFESEFGSNQSRGYSPGQTINIKRPPRYTYRAGRVAVPQSTVESTVALTLTQGGTDINFTAIERTLSLQQLNQKLQAAMATVANEVDRQGLDLVRTTVYQSAGTPGSPPSSSQLAVQLLAGANQRLDELAAPRDGNRCLIMGPALNASLVSGFSGLFNNQSKLDKQYNSGLFVDALGFAANLDQNVGRHANGSQSVTGTNISGAGQTGSSITVAPLGGTITRGTVIRLPNVFSVNPQSRVDTGNQAFFVVTADLPVGATSIPISPAIVTSGQFQNVTASPTNGSPFTIFGAASTGYDMNVLYHKDAFTLATVPLYLPQGGKGVVDAAQESYNGMTMRVIETYDPINDNFFMRFDVLFGWASTYPELACRVYI